MAEHLAASWGDSTAGLWDAPKVARLAVHSAEMLDDCWVGSMAYDWAEQTASRTVVWRAVRWACWMAEQKVGLKVHCSVDG